MDAKTVGLFVTLAALCANVALAFAGVPNTIACTVSYVGSVAQEVAHAATNELK